MLAAQFSLSERARTSKTDLLLELEQLFQRHHDAGERTVLIVDEAQSLPSMLLEEIRLLSNIEANDEKLLSIVIAGQPELADRLSDQSLRQLKQRIALRCELRPLPLRECGVYISSRIAAAGGVPAEDVHPRGGHADSRIFPRHPADDQCDCRQRPARRFREGTAPGDPRPGA